MKILLLEDNKTLNETIQLTLEKKGFKVYSFIDGKNALKNITRGFSCFILDINVPNIDGIKILEKIRQIYEEIPVIIISSSIELESIKKSYDFGCNEYIKKPFFMYELEIKLKKLCKTRVHKILFDEEAYFDFNNKRLIIGNNYINLTNKETLLMNIFLCNKNQITTYKNIENYVWNGDYCSLETIRTLIKRLRKKLNKSYIKASSSRGYIFKTHIDN